MVMVSLLNEVNHNIEERKRATQRREASQVYKKNASYAKNPMLELLENLLTGKAEKELHKGSVSKKDVDELLLDNGIQTFLEDHLDKLELPENQNQASKNTLEQHHYSLQDFHSVATSNEHLQAQLQAASSSEDDLFNRDRFSQSLTNRFIQSYNRNTNKSSLPGIVENFEKAYNNAISKYSFHMQMVQKNKFPDQPQYSISI